jgi:hypothetical protein
VFAGSRQSLRIDENPFAPAVRAPDVEFGRIVARIELLIEVVRTDARDAGDDGAGVVEGSDSFEQLLTRGPQSA